MPPPPSETAAEGTDCDSGAGVDFLGVREAGVGDGRGELTGRAPRSIRARSAGSATSPPRAAKAARPPSAPVQSDRGMSLSMSVNIPGEALPLLPLPPPGETLPLLLVARPELDSRVRRREITCV